MTDSKAPRRMFDSGWIELLATIIMSAAAILTAWAAFQSAKWSGVQAIEFSSANAARVESTRFDTRAGQLQSVDVDTFLAWLSAFNQEIQAGEVEFEPGEGYEPVEGTLSAFLFERMRDEFRPALDAWLATDPLLDPEAPATPFEMEAYALADAAAADEKLTEAAASSASAITANQNSDNHVLTGVAFALAIFFSGVSSKLRGPRNRIAAIILSAVIFVGAAATQVILPQVPPF